MPAQRTLPGGSLLCLATALNTLTLLVANAAALTLHKCNCMLYFMTLACVQDICKLRSDVLGSQHPDVAASHTAAGLALIELGETERAVQALQTAKGLLQRDARQEQQLKLVEQAERQVSTGGSSL
eukprot:GHRR01022849.1.p3 GENE.GHRR01022849.1~~GHRR01022849.1.p3  ORF type:complete len:126 (-),score=46.58 GHRR01022849.1:42-419(-)